MSVRIPMWRRYLRFWGPNPQADVDDELQQLSDTLAVLPKPGEVEPEGLRQLLDGRLEDLKKLLDYPPKNDASRNKLKSGGRNPPPLIRVFWGVGRGRDGGREGAESAEESSGSWRWWWWWCVVC